MCQLIIPLLPLITRPTSSRHLAKLLLLADGENLVNKILQDWMTKKQIINLLPKVCWILWTRPRSMLLRLQHNPLQWSQLSHLLMLWPLSKESTKKANNHFWKTIVELFPLMVSAQKTSVLIRFKLLLAKWESKDVATHHRRSTLMQLQVKKIIQQNKGWEEGYQRHTFKESCQ